MFGIRSYLEGFAEFYSHYFKTDHSDHLIIFERYFDYLATSSLRATIVFGYENLVQNKFIV
jgi:hypothetical protein